MIRLTVYFPDYRFIQEFASLHSAQTIQRFILKNGQTEKHESGGVKLYTTRPPSQILKSTIEVLE